MKALIEKSTNLVKYVWETLEFIDERQTQADWFIFGTDWSGNCIIKKVTNIPEDFVWNKYKYIDWGFELNPDYIEPELDDLI